MVAIIVLGAGLLAVAGATAATIRVAADGGVRAVAAGVLESVADSLRARPCAGIAGGSGRTRGIDVVWAVASVQGARHVTVTGTFDGMGRRRRVSLRTAIPCRLP
jgi:Tfp pilus assembly protein PilV